MTLGLLFLGPLVLTPSMFAQQSTGFYTITPCRVYDSRQGDGPVVGGVGRPVQIGSHCGIPPDATAVALNMTAVAPNAASTIGAFPTGVAQPSTVVVAFGAGATRASNAVIKLDSSGAMTALLAGPFQNQSHFIVDVSGYFRPSAQIQQWRRWEQTIVSTVDYTANGGSPYRDVRLFVRFTNVATGEGLVQIAYWNVDRSQPRVFKFGTALPAGTWTWQLESCTRSGQNCLGDGWAPSSGSVFVQSNTASGNPLWDLGFPGQEETIEGSETTAVSRFVYPDRSNFNWIADTAWVAPVREIAGQTNYWAAYIQDRKAKGFTAIQIAPAITWGPNPDPDVHCDDWANSPALPQALGFSFLTPPGCTPSGGLPYDCSDPNPAYWDEFALLVKEANDNGLTTAIFGVMNPTGINEDAQHPYPTEAGATTFAAWLAGKLSGFNVIYSPSFDDFASKAPMINAVGRVLRDTLKPLDPPPGYPRNLKRPALSVHLRGGATKCSQYRPFAQQAQADRWLTSYLFQSGHAESPGGDTDCPGNGSDLQNAMRRARQMPLKLDGYTGPQLPAVNAEGPYDPQGRSSPAGCVKDADTRLRVRQAGYLSALSNGAGFSYGAHRLFMWLDPASFVGLDSARDMTRLAGHLRGLNPVARHGPPPAGQTPPPPPTDGWILNQSAAEEEKMVLASAGTSRLMAYLPSRPGQGTIRISTANSGFALTCNSSTWLRKWYDPTSANTKDASQDACSAGSGWIELQAPTCFGGLAQCDWLLKIRKNTTAPWPVEAASAGTSTLDVWEEFSDEGSTTAIRAAIRGAAAEEAVDLSPTGRAFQSSPVVASLGDGFLAVWQAEGLDGSLSGVFGAQVDRSGELGLGPLPLNAYTEHNQREPSVAGRPDGEALVVWSSVGQAQGRTGIFGRPYRAIADPFGDPRGSEFQISEPDEGAAQNPQVVAFPGGYWVAWEVVDPTGQLTSIRIRHLTREGRPLGRELRVRAPLGEQVQLLDLEASSGSSLRARWWRLDRRGQLLGVARQEALPSGLIGAASADGMQ